MDPAFGSRHDRTPESDFEDSPFRARVIRAVAALSDDCVAPR